MTKRTRVKPTKMWAIWPGPDTYLNGVKVTAYRFDAAHDYDPERGEQYGAVMVVPYRDYLALKRAAKGRKR